MERSKPRQKDSHQICTVFVLKNCTDTAQCQLYLSKRCFSQLKCLVSWDICVSKKRHLYQGEATGKIGQQVGDHVSFMHFLLTQSHGNSTTSIQSQINEETPTGSLMLHRMSKHFNKTPSHQLQAKQGAFSYCTSCCAFKTESHNNCYVSNFQ